MRLDGEQPDERSAGSGSKSKEGQHETKRKCRPLAATSGIGFAYIGKTQFSYLSNDFLGANKVLSWG